MGDSFSSQYVGWIPSISLSSIALMVKLFIIADQCHQLLYSTDSFWCVQSTERKVIEWIAQGKPYVVLVLINVLDANLLINKHKKLSSYVHVGYIFWKIFKYFIAITRDEIVRTCGHFFFFSFRFFLLLSTLYYKFHKLLDWILWKVQIPAI